jgi:threonine/homoserine/homoserine lactone efflux protein
MTLRPWTLRLNRAAHSQSPRNMLIAVKGLSMEKWFCWAAMGTAGIVLLLFTLDLTLDMPFGLRSIGLAVDILGMICGAVLLYLGWNAYRDLR